MSNNQSNTLIQMDKLFLNYLIGPCIYRGFVFLIHSCIKKNEKRNRTPFFKLPLLTRNAIYSFRTYFRIPYSLRNAQNRSVFRFFHQHTHLKNEKNGKRLRDSVQCGMSFSVLPKYDPYLAIFYLVIYSLTFGRWYR